MAVEDKLEQGQRIRLECLALSLGYSAPGETAAGIVAKAKEFENFIAEHKCPVEQEDLPS